MNATTRAFSLAAIVLGLTLTACGGGTSSSSGDLQTSGSNSSGTPGTPGTPGTNSDGGGGAPNHAPALAGTPAVAVAEGVSYSFKPNATDSDNDPLVFDIANKPGWASFDAGTGVLSGTPGSTDVGTVSGVVISVTDGQSTVSLAPFDITVTATHAQLSWTPPTKKADGAPLLPGEMAGYRVYSGASPTHLALVKEIGDPQVTEYTLGHLTPSTYYFAVTALDVSGEESAFSNIESKTIN